MISTLKKKLNKRGFTLAELLIVVAIIAVLVAIAIPVFGGQLTKAKIATDKANVRAWYAECIGKYLTDESVTSVPSAGLTTVKIGDVDVALTQGKVTLASNKVTYTVTADTSNKLELPASEAFKAGT